jgi:hypothetical protein
MNANILPGAKDLASFRGSQVFSMRKVFTIRQVFSMRKVFTISQVSLPAEFLTGANVFVHIFRRLYFVYFLHFYYCKYAPII